VQPLARDGYTAEEVETVLRSSVYRYSSRFEILDPDMELVGELDTVTGAVVDMNIDRAIKGALSLRMLPDDRLRNVPLQFRIKPWFIIDMPDGGQIEFPLGVYAWAVESGTLDLADEVWEVELGDQLIILDGGGPGPRGFQVADGTAHTAAIGQILALGGITDLSGISPSGSRLVGPHAWGLTRVRQGWGFLYIDERRPERGWGFFHIDGEWVQEELPTRTTTLLDIAGELHEGLGYNGPWINPDGLYRATPTVDLADATAGTTYGSADDSITLPPIRKAQDQERIANRVFVWSENPEATTTFAEADANDIVPGHPWSQANTGYYRDKFVGSSSADTPDKAIALARKELLTSLSFYQRLSFDSFAWPVHEAFDIVGVWIREASDDLSTERLFHERAWSLNLLSGRMTHEVRRLWQPGDDAP